MKFLIKYFLWIIAVMVGGSTWAQTPLFYKEIDIDARQCLLINNFEVARSEADLQKLPLKRNAECESVDFGKINFSKNTLLLCNQYVHNGEEGIKSSRIEVLKNDRTKRIEVYFATFGSMSIQRQGQIFEYRKYLLVPKFPDDYKVEVNYSIHVVVP